MFVKVELNCKTFAISNEPASLISLSLLKTLHKSKYIQKQNSISYKKEQCELMYHLKLMILQ